jgi:MFS family permease
MISPVRPTRLPTRPARKPPGKRGALRPGGGPDLCTATRSAAAEAGWAAAESRPAERSAAYDRVFWLSYLANILAMVAISLLYRFADFVTLLGGSEYQLGWIVGIGMVGSLAMRLTMGTGIDHYGTRLIWLGSTVLLVLTCFAHLAITTCHTPTLYLLRILYCSSLAGFFGASITFVSSRVPVARVAELVGMIGTGGFLGTVFGAVLGDVMLGSGTVQRGQLDRVFVVAGLLATSALIFVHFATRNEQRPVPRARVPAWKLLRQFHPGLVLLVGVAMGGMVLNLPSTFLAPYTAQLGIPRIGLFFGVYAPAAIVTRLVTRRWTERFGNELLILLGTAGLVASQLAFLLVQSEWHLLLPGIGYGVSHAILFPAGVAAGMRCFPHEHRGFANALMLATWDTGQLVGTPAAGAVLQYSDPLGLPPYATMFGLLAGMTALVGVWYAAKNSRQ